MDLDEYLWRNKMSQRVFAEKVDVNSVTIFNLKNFKVIPNLLTAMKIFKFTDGQVTFHEMVSPVERKKYQVNTEQE